MVNQPFMGNLGIKLLKNNQDRVDKLEDFMMKLYEHYRNTDKRPRLEELLSVIDKETFQLRFLHWNFYQNQKQTMLCGHIKQQVEIYDFLLFQSEAYWSIITAKLKAFMAEKIDEKHQRYLFKNHIWQELVEKIMRPERLTKFADNAGMDLCDYLEAFLDG